MHTAAQRLSPQIFGSVLWNPDVLQMKEVTELRFQKSSAYCLLFLVLLPC